MTDRNPTAGSAQTSGGTTSGVYHGPAPAFSGHCLRNALKMGHCAPTVLQTLLEKQGLTDDAMVRAAGGLAGGIGGPGECGGICSPLIFFGLLHGQDRDDGGLPRAISLGQAYLSRFRQVHDGTRCGEIGGRGMGACIKAMCLSPALFEEVSKNETATTAEMPRVAREAYKKLLAAFENKGFHCAHDVFRGLDGTVAITGGMHKASWIFLGGLALTGSTCGALAAGVMAISAVAGGIERSYARTLRMIVMMMNGNKRALSDEVNAVNRAVRLAGGLASWFEEKYGSTRCSELTGADFSSPRSVEEFCAAGFGRCETITRGVAAKAADLLEEDRTEELR